MEAIRQKRGHGDSRAEGRKRSGMGLVCDLDSPSHGSDCRLNRKLKRLKDRLLSPTANDF